MDFFGIGIGFGAGFVMGSAQSCHAQHAAAGCYNCIIICEFSPGMKHDHIRIHVIKSRDRLSLLIASRIAAGSQNDADRLVVFPFQLYIGKTVFRHCQKDFRQIAFQSGQNRLGLRIAESVIELDDLRTVFRKHQADKQYAFEIQAVLLKARQRRFQDLLADLSLDLLIEEQTRRVSPHAARIRAFVIVKNTLIVLRGFHRHDSMFIHEAQHGSFHPCEEFFHNDLICGVSEDFIPHHFLDGLPGIRFIFRDDNTLAGRQTVGFQHHRIAEDTHRVQQFVFIGKFFVSRRRNIMSCQKVLGKRFAGFQLGALLIWSEGLYPGCFQLIHDPHGQRHFRTDDRQIDGIGLCKITNPVDIFRSDGNALGYCRDPRIARGAVNLVYVFTLGQLPADRMLSAAAAHDQYVHTRYLLTPSDGTVSYRRNTWRCRTRCRLRSPDRPGWIRPAERCTSRRFCELSARCR